MATESVEKLAQQFVASWSAIFESTPRYNLDTSWLSIGLVDRLLQGMRSRPVLADQDEAFLRGAAAYIACFVADCWQTMNPQGKVALVTSPVSFEITVSITASEVSSQVVAEIALYSALKHFLKELPGPVAVFGTLRRYLSRDQTALNAFLLGVVAARKPYVNGAWSEITEEDFGEQLAALVAHLAGSSAKHFFDSSPFGTHSAKPEMYLHQLILPPLQYAEPSLAGRAVAGMISYFESQNVLSEEMYSTAMELAASADETMSYAGFCIACALSTEAPSDKLKLLAQTFGISLYALRPTVALARHLLGRPDDWFRYVANEDFEQAFPLLEFERRMGFLPLLQSDSRLIREPRLQPFYDFVSRNEVEPAKAMFEIYVTVTGATPETLLQLAHLALFANDLPRTEACVKQLDVADCPTEYARHLYYSARAKLCERRQDLETAASYWQQALTEASPYPADYDTAITSLGASYISSGRYEDALTLCAVLLEKLPNRLSLLSLKSIALLALDRADDGERELMHLYTLAPFKPSVFGMLQSTLIARAVRG